MFDRKKACQALQASPDFRVDLHAPDDFDKFRRQFAYALMGIPSEEGGSHFKGALELIAKNILDDPIFNALRNPDPKVAFDINKFTISFNQAIESYSEKHGKLDDIYFANSYILRRYEENRRENEEKKLEGGDVKEFNYEDYKELRKYYGLPQQCFLFGIVFPDLNKRQEFEKQFQKDLEKDNAALKALRGSGRFNAGTDPSKNFDKFCKNFAYFFLDLGCDEAMSISNDDISYKFALRILYSPAFKELKKIHHVDSFNIDQFEKDFQAAIRDYSMHEVKMEDLYEVEVYFFNRKYKKDKDNYEVYKEMRGYFNLPADFPDFEKITVHERFIFEEKYKKDHDAEAPVLAALRNSSKFKVDPGSADDFDKFRRQFAYFLLGIYCEESRPLENNIDYNDLARALLGDSVFEKLKINFNSRDSFNIKEFEKDFDQAIKDFSSKQGNLEQIYNANLYLGERLYDISTENKEKKLEGDNAIKLNYEDYKKLRKDFNLPKDCYLLINEFKHDLEGFEKQFQEDLDKYAAKSFLSGLKCEDGTEIKLEDNRLISFRSYSASVPEDKLDGFIRQHLGAGATRLASVGNGTEYTPAVGGQCYVHITRFDLDPLSPGGSPPAEARKACLVAVDRVNRAGQRETDIRGVPGDLKELEWEVYLKMAETILLNIIFSRPCGERKEPVVIYDIDPAAPTQLLAAMQFSMEKAGRKNQIQFICDGELKNKIDNCVRTIPSGTMSRVSRADSALMTLDVEPPSSRSSLSGGM